MSRIRSANPRCCLTWSPRAGQAAPKRRLTWPELQEQVLQRLPKRGRKLKLQANLPAAYVNDNDSFVRLPRRAESLRVIGCGDAATRSAKRAPLVVVDFLSEQRVEELCAPCAQLKPEIHQLSQEMPEVDVDMNSEAADLYQITSLPTLVFIRNQKVLGRYEGGCERFWSEILVSDFVGVPQRHADQLILHGQRVCGSDVDELTLKLLEYK
eukprot:Skav219580  [mRNA]  locus=scaffold249:196359:200696:+ [translate_table: standard]